MSHTNYITYENKMQYFFVGKKEKFYEKINRKNSRNAFGLCPLLFLLCFILSLQRILRIVKLGVVAVLFKQFAVRALLGDLAVAYVKNVVRTRYC